MPRGEFDRSPRKARNRAALLEAAARVYARRGFDGATVDEVAEDAGFTKGAVYSHFGSKENLLLALLDERVAAQIGEQIALFDPTQNSWERPRIGADRWMAELRRDPESFRLFVELWARAQRDDELRERLVEGLGAWRAMSAGFASRNANEGGFELSEAWTAQWANAVIGLSVGLGMVELIDEDSVAPGLLGAVLAILVHALETSEEARAMLDRATAPSEALADGPE
jgi:AcrR family transcriptional regulator